jgi:SAM-dependent methyltransferase
MWKRFAETVRCPLCRGSLDLNPIATRTASPNREHLETGEWFGLSGDRLTSAVDSGLLSCGACKVWYPVFHGLPILLPYTTATHHEFLAAHGDVVTRLGGDYDSPRSELIIGEAFVQRSFSKEWLEYEFDGVLWTWTYADREQLFLDELGREPAPPVPARFLEIGCGLGLVTSFAARHFPGDAVGVDLSLAALRAARHFREHPFLHFVQASLWHLPFAMESFDLLYSHGVLHHTYSTERAFKTVSRHVKPGGRAYVWVYGKGELNETITRRVAYGVEVVLRPILARLPASITAAMLVPFAAAYIGLNRLQRLGGRRLQPYNFSRAMHAARDRLTPLFAFHHEAAEVARWFGEAGFSDIHQVTQDEVAESNRVVLRRNVGVRGRKPVASVQAGHTGAPDRSL